MQIELDPPANAINTARSRVERGPVHTDHVDHSDVAFWSIDPEGSRDLDQALFLERRGSEYTLHYAIADVGAWVEPGDAIDTAARERGTTIYCPDRRAALHPTVLSEGAASLLADGRPRPALHWRIELDQRGATSGITVVRAMVRNTAARSYYEVQGEVDAGRPDPQTELLREIGHLRQELEVARGGISLQLPEQSVRRVDDHYELEYEAPLAAEDWNAQLSLCTGMAAASLMIGAGIGILRTLPAAAPGVIDRLRRQADALGFAWPSDQSYPAFIRLVDGTTARGAALMTQAAKTLRGAGYVSFDGAVPADHQHAAVAAPYAHVTAPLRRLVDRTANECVLAATAGTRPAGWVLEALAELPQQMSAANQRASAVDRAVIDICEAAILTHRVGEVFDGRVLSISERGATVQLVDPAVIATVRLDTSVDGSLGEAVRVRLVTADPNVGQVKFSPA